MARTREAVERICAVELDDRVLRARVIDHIRAGVDFTWYAWVLTDPSTCVGRSVTIEPPDPGATPDLVRLKYLTAARRWTDLPRDRVITMAGDRDLERGALWDGVLGPHGVTDALSLALHDAYGCWGFLDLWRTTGVFQRAEIGLLTGLSPLLTRAVRRSVAATFVSAQPPPAVGPGELVLTDELVPSAPAASPFPDQLPLRTIIPTQGADAATPVPVASQHVAAQLLAVEAGIDDHPPWARVHLGQGCWVTVRAQRPHDPGAGISVTVEPTTEADRAELFAHANGLSRRESEVLALLLRGGRTRDLAEAMHVSQHTVQDHLKAVFTKTGTHSRPDLVARAAGAQTSATSLRG